MVTRFAEYFYEMRDRSVNDRLFTIIGTIPIFRCRSTDNIDRKLYIIVARLNFFQIYHSIENFRKILWSWKDARMIFCIYEISKVSPLPFPGAMQITFIRSVSFLRYKFPWRISRGEQRCLHSRPSRFIYLTFLLVWRQHRRRPLMRKRRFRWRLAFRES